MSTPRIRPDRETFRDLCRRHTQREIATMYGVSQASVSSWQKIHGCIALREDQKKHRLGYVPDSVRHDRMLKASEGRPRYFGASIWRGCLFD